MRVVEPGSFKESAKPKKAKRFSKKFGLFLVMTVLISGFLILRSDRAISPAQEQSQNAKDEITQSDATSSNSVPTLRTFSGNEFRLLFDNITLPNVSPVPLPPAITGNDIADTRIRQIAEGRGYRLRSSPVVPLSSVDGYQLQSPAHQPWLNLKKAGLKAGYKISVTSGYRSVENQKSLFLNRLYAEGVTVSDIAKGNADTEIDKVLVTTALPGYSKHHTGYTIDLLCEGYAFENFKNSPCNEWLVADNYYQAKVHGFIPSYPLDADMQGPDYEAWEYVYVGTEVLYR